MPTVVRAVVAAALFALVVAVGVDAGAQVAPTERIESTQAGPLAIGQSLESLRADLPEPYSIGDELQIFPDLEGYAISVDGAIQAFVATGEADETVRLIILVNLRFQTPEGIGPGATVAAAEAAYGAASLEWFPDDRGTEVVEFEDQPEFLQFLTSDAGGPRAGVYAEGALATDEYQEAARLSTVWIDCRTRICPQVADEPDAADDAAEEDADGADETETDGTEADADDEEADGEAAEDGEDIEDIEDMMAPDDTDEPVFPDADEDPGETLPDTGFSADETFAAFGFTLLGLGCTLHLLRRRV